MLAAPAGTDCGVNLIFRQRALEFVNFGIFQPGLCWDAAVSSPAAGPSFSVVQISLCWRHSQDGLC